MKASTHGPPVLAEATHFLSCPHCGQRPALEDGALVCPGAHRFDLARQGYVNLLRGDEHLGTADTADMVAARERFIAAGHFVALRQAIATQAIATASNEVGCVVEVGAGTGYHLAGVLDRFENAVGLALDISKPALRRAARAHLRMAAIGCDVWGRLPIADGAADLVLDVFAPRNAPELHRVLRPGGVLVVATPTSDHLVELVDHLDLVTVDCRKEQRLADSLGSRFARTEAFGETGTVAPSNSGFTDPPGRARIHVERILLDHATVTDVVGMGPTARHVDAGALRRRIAALPDPFGVTLSVSISTWIR